MEPVYRKKSAPSEPGARTTWMDRFVELDPVEGCRAVARQVWRGTAPTID